MRKGKYYPRKFVNFNPDDKEDMKLYNDLKRLGHGDFSEMTKAHWKKQLKECDNGESIR